MKFYIQSPKVLLFLICSILIFSSSCSKDTDLFEILSEEEIDETEEVLDSQNQEEIADSQGDEEGIQDGGGSEENIDPPNDEVTDSTTRGDNQTLNIIFDTDANNELDDQHALAYLLSNGDIFNLEALTVNSTPTGGGIQNDFDEATRILQLYNLQNDITVHLGAQGNYSTIRSGFDPNSFDGQAAVNQIIASTKSKECIIVAVGKLTNVALAILKDPTIVNRTKVIWLGTNYPCADEYNLESDMAAVNFVLNSDMPMDIVTVRLSCPQQGSSEVNTTVTEINNVMPGLGPLATTPITGRHGGSFSRFGDYSVDLFNNIGKELRSLFDVVALAILKEPGWGQKEVIPAPLYENDSWTERPANPREVTIWGDFDRNSIMEDFFESIENYTLVE